MRSYGKTIADKGSEQAINIYGVSWEGTNRGMIVNNTYTSQS